MNSEDINVIYHCDDLYIDYLLVSIYSVHTHNNKVVFHIITNCKYDNIKKLLNLASSHKIEIKIYAVSHVLFDRYNIPEKYKRLTAPHPIKPIYEITKQQYINEIPFTAAPLYYFVLHHFLFSFEKGIFLDCDTIVTQDIQKLYNIELGSKLVAMCKDWSRKTITYKNKEYKAYNGSVYVSKIKDFGVYVERMYDHVLDNLDWAKYGLQHSMNVLIQDIVLEIDSKWNTSIKHKVDRPYIWHYNTIIKHPELKDNLYKEYENSCHR